jgi:adenylate cyclase
MTTSAASSPCSAGAGAPGSRASDSRNHQLVSLAWIASERAVGEPIRGRSVASRPRRVPGSLRVRGELTRDDVAIRAGVTPDYVDALAEHGIVRPDVDGLFTAGGARATRVIHDLERAGLPFEGIARAVEGGHLSFEVFDLGNYDRFAALTPETFRQVAERTGIPLELLLVVREAVGFAVADPDDHLREDELEVLPIVESAIAGGFPPSAIERLLRVFGESLRRMVETATEGWTEHLVRPLIESGTPVGRAFEIASSFGDVTMPLMDRAILAIHRGQQDHVWMNGIYDWVEGVLDDLGLRAKVDRPPAMCFLDLSGFTRLTEERGDEAAATIARTFGQLVQRTAHERHGRVVKWLGDGVMLYFEQPSAAIDGALEMVDRAPTFGLPAAHVGVDAGPVIIQDGDFFGGTVNVAARIAAYARGGEVLASERAVEAARDLPSNIRSTDLGPVDLKGVSRPVNLRRLERT